MNNSKKYDGFIPLDEEVENIIVDYLTEIHDPHAIDLEQSREIATGRYRIWLMKRLSEAWIRGGKENIHNKKGKLPRLYDPYWGPSEEQYLAALHRLSQEPLFGEPKDLYECGRHNCHICNTGTIYFNTEGR